MRPSERTAGHMISISGDGAQLPFARLDPLVRVLQYLGLGAEAEPYRQRPERAACVPLQPLPDGGRWPREET